jgi:phosphoribosylamine---glycine ligase
MHNVLLIGSGGRENAFAQLIVKSKSLNQLYIAPGNAGTHSLGKNVAINENDFEALKAFALQQNIDLIVVGPEIPLVNGIVDFFENDTSSKHIKIVGPNKVAAQLEGSKDFSKSLMQKYNIPTAKYFTATKQNFAQATQFLESLTAPFVLKADGLAAGKGVLIVDEIEEAKTQLSQMLLHSKFGEASNKVVIEEFLNGIELSVFVATDGVNYKILPTAKDYKRILNNDQGLNTGGMGAVAPVPFANPKFMQLVEQSIVIPTLKALQSEQIPYTGFIFIGIMNVNEIPYVIEYNCRMGDPETEAVLPLLENDFLEFLFSITNKTLHNCVLNHKKMFSVAVVMASEGYPEEFEKGKVINHNNLSIQNTQLFFAGAQHNNKNQVVSTGGRVAVANAMHKDLHSAIELAYNKVNDVVFENKYCRTDIGQDLIKYIK